MKQHEINNLNGGSQWESEDLPPISSLVSTDTVCANGIKGAHSVVLVRGVPWFRVRGEKGWFTPLSCKECSETFAANRRYVLRRRVKYCSRLCLNRANAKAPKSHPDQRGEKNHNWKGGYSASEHKRNFQRKNPAKVGAHHLFRAALRAGKIARPSSCSACGKICKPHGHHEDYSRPLDVRWLCQQCHNAWHAEQRAKASAGGPGQNPDRGCA